MLSKNFTFWLLVAACVVSGVVPLRAEDAPPPRVVVKDGAPEGFEVYEGPHETAVDLYYGGLKVGSFRAVYTPKSIVFATPDEIANKIPALKHEMTMRVQNAITGELPTEADKICGHLPVKGCGVLQPEVAAVIFYEDKFRVDLFINPDMLAVQDTHTDKILPPAPDVFSSVHSLNGGVTGTAGAPQNYSLLSNSTIAYGAGRVNLIGIASNTQKQINTMSASLDKWGLENKLGFFDSHATQLLPQVQMSGVSVGTSLNTNLALRDAAGSRLSIFLSQRAWVSLIYNNVIYTTDFYEAGNQVLNTDSLPEGAYQITIRIRDASGGQTEETRFFAKNFEIPPESQPIYFGQVGTIRETTQTGRLPNIGTGIIANGGTVQRLTENTGVDENIELLKNRLYNEAGAFLLLPPDHQLRMSLLLGSARDYGFGASYLGYAMDKKLAFANDFRAIFAGSTSTTDVTDPANLVSSDSRQLSSNVSYQLTELANIGLQGNYSKGSASPQFAYGPTLHYDFWREGESNLTLTADSRKTQNGMVHGVLLRYTKRLGAWGYSGEGNVRSDAQTAGSSNNLSKSGDSRVTWNDDKDPGNLTVIGAEANRSSFANTYTADLDHRGTYGNVKMTGSQTQNGPVSNNFYSGNLSFGVAQTGRDISWGGNQQQTSGVIIQSTGNSSDVPMKVMVNNSDQSSFKTGGSVALFVPPYQTYDISIRPTQSVAIDYDGAVKHVTLYPGNILPMVWDINRIFVVLGHVLLPDGTPLTNARLEESRNIAVTDEEGMFQAELLTLKTLTFKRGVEEPAMAAIIKSREQDVDIFSILPPLHPHQSRPSKMSQEDQNKAMTELFGTEGAEATPTAENPFIAKEPELAADSSHQMQTPMPSQPSKKPIEPLRCQVTLPEVKEINGVYIYPVALTCNPIALEEDKQKPDDKDKAAQEDPLPSLLEEMAASAPVPAPLTPLLADNAPPQLLPSAGSELVDALLHAGAKPVMTEIIAVQLGAYRTEAKALEMQNALIRTYSELSGKTSYITQVDLGAKGIYYRLRLGDFATAQDASAFCHNLVAQGQSCMLPIGIAARAAGVSYAVAVSPENAHASLLRLPKGKFSLPLPTALAQEEDIQETLPDPLSYNRTLTVPPHLLTARADIPAPVAADPAPAKAAPVILAQAQSPAAQAALIRVQLGAYRTESKAVEMQQLIMKKYSELSGKTPYIIKADLGEKGIYYRLRVGNFGTSRDASAFCSDLSAKGQSCIVPVEETRRETPPESKEHAALFPSVAELLSENYM